MKLTTRVADPGSDSIRLWVRKAEKKVPPLVARPLRGVGGRVIKVLMVWPLVKELFFPASLLDRCFYCAYQPWSNLTWILILKIYRPGSTPSCIYSISVKFIAIFKSINVDGILKSEVTIVTISDGSSEYEALVWCEIVILIFVKHLFTSTAP